MKVTRLAIPEVVLLQPKVFGDERGFFYESFNQQRFEEAIGRRVPFVQDNHSCSAKGVLRGLHFQRPPHAQAKLVRCVIGAVHDVVVDLRDGSPTFGRGLSVTLDAGTGDQLYVPAGFAHGFMTLTPDTRVAYKAVSFTPPTLPATRLM